MGKRRFLRWNIAGYKPAVGGTRNIQKGDNSKMKIDDESEEKVRVSRNSMDKDSQDNDKSDRKLKTLLGTPEPMVHQDRSGDKDSQDNDKGNNGRRKGKSMDNKTPDNQNGPLLINQTPKLHQDRSNRMGSRVEETNGDGEKDKTPKLHFSNGPKLHGSSIPSHTPLLSIYDADFSHPSVDSKTMVSHPVDGFLAPIYLSPGGLAHGSMPTQFALLDPNEIPEIQNSMELNKGEYLVKFDWQSLSPSGSELDVFLNHKIVGSFKADNSDLQTKEVHITACDCCEGKNVLKFVCVGRGPCGVDNFSISNSHS